MGSTSTRVPALSRPARRHDRVRRTAFEVLREVTGQDAFANLALGQALTHHQMTGRDAALCTELVSGTCRMTGTLDAIIETAAGRPLGSLQPAVVDVLRLGAYQLLATRIPTHAAVTATVDLAALSIGERVAGVVNAITRKVSARSLDQWLDQLTAGLDAREALALRTWHPRWIVDAYADVLPAEELADALAAGNVPPVPTLVVRPGLAEVADLDGEPTRYSPFGARRPGNPGDVPAVKASRAGVQDEGSQLVAAALAGVEAPAGPWLDVCAGPGGKAALLRGLADRDDNFLVAAELLPHRAGLVAQSLAGYPGAGHQVVVADGTVPAWRADGFARVLLDAPCTGLGSLRRRPESRWRKRPDQIAQLAGLQSWLLDHALDSVVAGGVLAYVTCSPHPAETAAVVAGVADRVEVLDAPAILDRVARTPVPGAAAATDPRYVQLWPHRHGTDAMFLALLRKT